MFNAGAPELEKGEFEFELDDDPVAFAGLEVVEACVAVARTPLEVAVTSSLKFAPEVAVADKPTPEEKYSASQKKIRTAT